MTDGPQQSDRDQPNAALLGALRYLLRPLIRLLIDRGIGFPYLAELLKGVYVEVADSHFALPDKRQTDSRITLLTGVHRKDVKRLRNTQISDTKTNPPLSAQLIARWLGQSIYCDADGLPKPLPRLASKGGNASFEMLVSSVSKDIRPRAVLDEWLRQGIARLDEQDRMHLLTDAIIPDQDVAEKSHYFGRNLHDHIAASSHNLLGEQPPLLERIVYYDHLTPAAVAQLAALARREGMQALQQLNRVALELQQAAEGDPQASQRMSFGVYFYTPPEAGDD